MNPLYNLSMKMAMKELATERKAAANATNPNAENQKKTIEFLEAMQRVNGTALIPDVQSSANFDTLNLTAEEQVFAKGLLAEMERLKQDESVPVLKSTSNIDESTDIARLLMTEWSKK